MKTGSAPSGLPCGNRDHGQGGRAMRAPANRRKRAGCAWQVCSSRRSAPRSNTGLRNPIPDPAYGSTRRWFRTVRTDRHAARRQSAWLRLRRRRKLRCPGWALQARRPAGAAAGPAATWHSCGVWTSPVSLPKSGAGKYTGNSLAGKSCARDVRQRLNAA